MKSFRFSAAKRHSNWIFLLFLVAGCKAKSLEPINDRLMRVWKAKTVKESTTLVYTEGAANSVKPGYARFRLDLSKPGNVVLRDVDGRDVTGTWTLSTDNQRLILQNLTPIPTNTGGIIEYYIRGEASEATLSLERTAESRKTGNSVNAYELIPE